MNKILITTSVPTGVVVAGHVIVEGVGLDAKKPDPYRLQLAWNFDGSEFTGATALLFNGVSLREDITLVDENGKYAIILPSGEGCNAVVSYVGPTRDGIKAYGWTIKEITEEEANTMLPLVDFELVEPFTNNHLEVPVGVPVPFTSTEVPDGFLPYTGITFDTAKFPKLAEIYPSGKLLDLRGDVIRAAEIGRVLLTHQDQSVQPLTFIGDEMSPHLHGGVTTHTSSIGGVGFYGNGYRQVFTRNTSSVSAGTPTGKIDGTGSETRMANTSFIYITRAA